MSQDTASAAAASSPDNAPAADRLVPAGNVGDPWPPDDRAPDVPDDWPPDPLDEEWEDWLEAQSPRPPEALPAGLLPRDCGDGPGFAAGGVADRLAPDVALAGFARDAWADGLDRLSDDELIGVLRAWRRLNSWTAAGELAAVTELNDRRIAQVAAGADPHLAEHVDDELAVSLTLTARSADALLEFACGLARLPVTRAALAAGEIDRAKALVITEEVGCLDDAHAAAVEAAIIGRAPARPPAGCGPRPSGPSWVSIRLPCGDVVTGLSRRPASRSGTNTRARQHWPAGTCLLPTCSPPTSGSMPWPSI